MISEKTFGTVDSMLSQTIRSLDPDMLRYCKQFFEGNFLSLLQSRKLEIVIMVDAEAIISDAYGYIRKGVSYIQKLKGSPFVKLCAPSYLLRDLEGTVPRFSKKMKLDETVVRNTVQIISKDIQLIDANDEESYEEAKKQIGWHDKGTDVEYIATYLAIKPHGIITKDKAIKSVKDIKIWTKGQTGKVASVYEEGAVSFLFISKGLPLIFRLVYELFIFLLRTLWEAIVALANAAFQLMERIANGFAKLKPGQQLVVGLAALILLYWEDSRKAIFEFVSAGIADLANFLAWIYNILKGIIEFIAPIIDTSIISIAILFRNVEDTIKMYAEINPTMQTG